MNDREPKDYHLARRAYEAFHDEQPQIWFENLSHEYQMRWVRAARAVQRDAKIYARQKSIKIPAPVDSEGDVTAQMLDVYASAPRQSGGQVDYKALDSEEARRRVRQAYRYLWARKLLPKK